VPKVVVILAGTNDIAGNSGPIADSDVEANFRSLAELARAHNIRVVLSSILPVHNYTPESEELFAQRLPERILLLNRWLKNYCSANVVTYLDYFSSRVDGKGLLKRDLATDGLHPNQVGYSVMVPLAQAAIDKELK
jgi:lysophospholipase L1-like esterase